MGTRDSNSPLAFGFLTVVRHQQHGLFGGYLLLNRNARPLEFHCTTPVKPNRAQEILYGPTLEPYLYGEQIGRTLLSKAGVEPLVVWTDLPSVLAVREHVSVPVAVVLPGDENQDLRDSHSAMIRVDDSHAASPNRRGHHLATFQLGSRNLAVEPAYASDQQTITERLAALADRFDVENFDLVEPFDRIREAIEEAQRGSR